MQGLLFYEDPGFGTIEAIIQPVIVADVIVNNMPQKGLAVISFAIALNITCRFIACSTAIDIQ
jgi:hypothetical protein